jgi:hypothetical protein
VVFGPVAFSDLSNVSTVAAGTYALNYVDEMTVTTAGVLTAGIGVADSTINFSAGLTGNPPLFVLIDSEVIGVVSVTGLEMTVQRAQHGTAATAHSAGATVFTLAQQVVVVPFVKNFFGTPASGEWSYPVSLPNIRIISAELTVTNSQGNSPTSSVNFTNALDGGLRTLSGGQYSFQVGGFLAVQTGAAPNIIIDGPRVVRDAYAVVGLAPVGAPVVININLNGNLYCTLTIADSTTMSADIDGASLPGMNYQDLLSIDIAGVGLTTPGSDLTVIIRV